MFIKAGIDASGYRTAVRDYTEFTVVEELAANSYDADSSTCIVLLDTAKSLLHVVDDGIGFTEEAIQRLAILGGGSKQNIPFSAGQRHYLGSYGYGLKSSLNIAEKVHVFTISEEGQYKGVIDWSQLDHALQPGSSGFDFQKTKRLPTVKSGTHLCLKLRNPATLDQLPKFAGVLSNLPTDGGKFLCYVGVYEDAVKSNHELLQDFRKLQSSAKKLLKSGKLELCHTSLQSDLENCEVVEFADKDDPNVKAKLFFAGIQNGEVTKLKRGLRGIYVRIHGRLLKQSFTDSTYTYNISRWKKFESGLRVELSVDWLRDQISLSREGIRFSNPKLEHEFKSLLGRCVGRFIQPQLKKLEKKAQKASSKKYAQRLALAKKRVVRDKSILVSGLKNGFAFRPETDGELALLLGRPEVLKTIGPNYLILDYNDQAAFDCLFYDKSSMSYVNVELEPTLMEWLGHADTSAVQMIVVWTLGKWRMGAKKRGSGGMNQLVADDPPSPGRYSLLEFATEKSKSPRRKFQVIALDELLG